MNADTKTKTATFRVFTVNHNTFVVDATSAEAAKEHVRQRVGVHAGKDRPLRFKKVKRVRDD